MGMGRWPLFQNLPPQWLFQKVLSWGRGGRVERGKDIDLSSEGGRAKPASLPGTDSTTTHCGPAACSSTRAWRPLARPQLSAWLTSCLKSREAVNTWLPKCPELQSTQTTREADRATHWQSPSSPVHADCVPPSGMGEVRAREVGRGAPHSSTAGKG